MDIKRFGEIRYRLNVFVYRSLICLYKYTYYHIIITTYQSITLGRPGEILNMFRNKIFIYKKKCPWPFVFNIFMVHVVTLSFPHHNSDPHLLR